MTANAQRERRSVTGEQPMISITRSAQVLRRTVEVLKDIDLEIDQGEVVCVIGPSGSGKTTLLRCVNLLEEPTCGQDLRQRHRGHRPGGRPRRGPPADRHGVPAVQPVPAPVRAAEPDASPQQRVLKRGKAEAESVARQNLERVGLAHKADGLPGAALRRPAAAGGDRPGAVHGPGADALRRADLGARPRTRRRRARGHARTSPTRA